MSDKLVVILIASLLFLQLSLITTKADPPVIVGIGGLVTKGGVPVANATVTITNINTSDSIIVNTTSAGYYAAGLTAVDSEIILVTAISGSYSGSNTTIVNTANVTQFCNVVMNMSTGLIVRFTYWSHFPKVNEEVHFTGNANTGSPISWFWSFGDGEIASGKNVQHIFRVASIFDVTVSITDGVNYDTYSDSVTVISENSGNIGSSSIVGGEKTTTKNPFKGTQYIPSIPGFESLVFILAVAFIILVKRRNKKE